MALIPGTQLGSYEIVDLLGAGGMGEGYRASDTRLGRDVALKTLPDSVTRDPERLARFRREAHVLAALNHQHMANGSEEARQLACAQFSRQLFLAAGVRARRQSTPLLRDVDLLSRAWNLHRHLDDIRIPVLPLIEDR